MALLDWAAAGQLTEEVAAKLRPVLQSGVHDRSIGFTDAYFHIPAELRYEVEQAGFVHTRVLGIEGPAWTAVGAAGPDRQQAFIESALICARAADDLDDTLTAMSGHLMAVARVAS